MLKTTCVLILLILVSYSKLFRDRFSEENDRGYQRNSAPSSYSKLKTRITIAAHVLFGFILKTHFGE
ncbi:hypothetical protein C5Y97_10340 [Blastopirellula marina]|uniref:Uncharacterized protein n=1 Tax=Blastopirellula marina TaxID=124 RepID=A0A2S8G1X2_9BACT|nr:hypothetical protein C5Y98_10330 [Blastopirellula marina]PTL45102.1 hypothetical protein C5Y97_10340 [Blastopirellula marina]